MGKGDSEEVQCSQAPEKALTGQLELFFPQPSCSEREETSLVSNGYKASTGKIAEER